MLIDQLGTPITPNMIVINCGYYVHDILDSFEINAELMHNANDISNLYSDDNIDRVLGIEIHDGTGNVYYFKEAFLSSVVRAWEYGTTTFTWRGLGFYDHRYNPNDTCYMRVPHVDHNKIEASISWLKEGF
jgi:hypothetical protein